MSDYKPVECQSLEKEEELLLCQSWDCVNKCCKAIYSCQVSPVFNNYTVNRDNFDKNCSKNNGNSNKSRCCSFKDIYFNESQLKKEREKLRKIFIKRRSL